MNSTQNSINHLSVILDKLQTNEPFALIRPADGEYAVMIGKHLTNIDNWTFSGGMLQRDLLEIKNLKKDLNNFFIGIPCPECQGIEMTNYMKKTLEISEKELTYANIFCNQNWKYFTNFLIKSKRPLYYVGPGTNTNNSLNIQSIFTIDKLLVNKWDKERNTFIENITNWVRDNTKQDKIQTFVFSCGPISKYIIPILYKLFPNNQFMDVGSTFDFFMLGSSNRPYTIDNDTYSKVVCSFERGHVLYNRNDIAHFQGGWSYTQNEMLEFLKHINIRDSYKILEFGAGNSTKILYDIIERFCYDIEYDTFENDRNFYVTHKKVNTIMYDVDDIDLVITPNKKYDIIIIDGPNGVLRAKWYNKIRENIKSDTILLIDDYNHYSEFESQLNENFTYNILSKSDVPFVPYGEHSWRILNNIQLKPVTVNHIHSAPKFITAPNNDTTDITVILNMYKRPHVIVEQINAIRNQTIKPKQIIIWKNYVEGIDIPEEVKSDKSIIIVECNKNLGVWPRFMIGLLATTEFVAVFDDDTIPGSKWFENCLNTIKVHNGLLGSIGLLFHNSSRYSGNYIRIGWDGPRNTTTKVDLVGHAWFFRREWILELYRILPNYDDFLICGEDMGFSWALQQIGIDTFVPPHPPNDLEMYGSNPKLAYKYGTESVAISMDYSCYTKFDKMFTFYKNKGFNFINK
jgi:hypothetical protein